MNLYVISVIAPRPLVTRIIRLGVALCRGRTFVAADWGTETKSGNPSPVTSPMTQAPPPQSADPRTTSGAKLAPVERYKLCETVQLPYRVQLVFSVIKSNRPSPSTSMACDRPEPVPAFQTTGAAKPLPVDLKIVLPMTRSAFPSPVKSPTAPIWPLGGNVVAGGWALPKPVPSENAHRYDQVQNPATLLHDAEDMTRSS